jgi:hypothetical protein
MVGLKARVTSRHKFSLTGRNAGIKTGFCIARTDPPRSTVTVPALTGGFETGFSTVPTDPPLIEMTEPPNFTYG